MKNIIYETNSQRLKNAFPLVKFDKLYDDCGWDSDTFIILINSYQTNIRAYDSEWEGLDDDVYQRLHDNIQDYCETKGITYDDDNEHIASYCKKKLITLQDRLWSITQEIGKYQSRIDALEANKNNIK